MDILSLIFTGLLNIVMVLVQIVLTPIDALILNFIPELETGFEATTDFLTLVANGLGWAISATGVPYFAIAMVGTYLIVRYTLPFNLWFMKLALSWYKTLKR